MLRSKLRNQVFRATSRVKALLRSLRPGMLAAGLAIVVGVTGNPRMSRADVTSGKSYTVYMYDSGGTPADVTAYYNYTDQHLYDNSGILTDNVLTDGTVQNLQGQNVGFMVFGPS